MKLIGVMSQQKDKILIITPTSNRKQQQQNHERTGEYTPRARMTAELGKIIDDGLRWYEEELRHDRPIITNVCFFSFLRKIFERIFFSIWTEKATKLINQEEKNQSKSATENKTNINNEEEEINKNFQSKTDKGKNFIRYQLDNVLFFTKRE